jgi:hypothetical protein
MLSVATAPPGIFFEKKKVSAPKSATTNSIAQHATLES